MPIYIVTEEEIITTEYEYEANSEEEAIEMHREEETHTTNLLKAKMENERELGKREGRTEARTYLLGLLEGAARDCHEEAIVSVRFVDGKAVPFVYDITIGGIKTTVHSREEALLLLRGI